MRSSLNVGSVQVQSSQPGWLGRPFSREAAPPRRKHRCWAHARKGSEQAPASSVSRQQLLRSTAAGVLVSLAIGSDDPTTILNSVLSAYGLPTLKASAGFKIYDDFDAGYAFEYPKSWVIRRNILRQGIYISDFQVSSPVPKASACIPEKVELQMLLSCKQVHGGFQNLPKFVGCF